jgi:hypothetical protein
VQAGLKLLGPVTGADDDIDGGSVAEHLAAAAQERPRRGTDRQPRTGQRGWWGQADSGKAP